MQIYALEKNRLISAKNAEKAKDYRCPECLGRVRYRGGKLRQSHFFHLKALSSCRQSQKGLIHLHMQLYLKDLLQHEGPVMEKIFPERGRIADVACLQTKKIFEIQYSPMSLKEAKARCLDYESLGFEMVWILHDHTFNQKKIAPSEQFLRTKTCYFSNMDAEGKGVIYDQFEQIVGKRRQFIGPKKEVDLRVLMKWPKIKMPPLRFLEKRAHTWPFYHRGDLIDLALSATFSIPKIPQKKPWFNRLKEAYLVGFYMLLSRSSK